MIISERIFELIDEKGMSQKEFSEKTGIAQSTISDWKRKHTNPSADKIMAIAHTLNVPAEELLCGTEIKGAERPYYMVVDSESETGQLFERIAALSPRQRSRVEGYLDSLLK